MKFGELNRITLTVLAGIILIAAFFRFHNLDKWGPIFYDEGQYISEAYYTKDVLLWSLNFIATVPVVTNKAEVIDQLVHRFDSSGQPLKTGRPVHNLLTAIGLLIFSSFSNPTNYTLAFFGVVNVFLTFILSLLVTKSKK